MAEGMMTEMEKEMDQLAENLDSISMSVIYHVI
jgi:hypothetical protein